MPHMCMPIAVIDVGLYRIILAIVYPALYTEQHTIPLILSFRLIRTCTCLGKCATLRWRKFCRCVSTFFLRRRWQNFLS